MTIRAVAFDVYDTLARYPDSRVTNIEIQQELERYGIPISYQAYEAARQGVFFFDACKRPIHGWIDFLSLAFHRMGVKVSLDIVESLAAMHDTRNDMVIFPDAIACLREVRSMGLKSCAFTTLPKFMLGRAADELIPEIDHYFDSPTVGLAKGDRRFYAEITSRLGCAPGEILCVGDDPICDVKLPAREGWRPVLLDRDGKIASPPDEVVVVVRSLDELPMILRTDR